MRLRGGGRGVKSASTLATLLLADEGHGSRSRSDSMDSYCSDRSSDRRRSASLRMKDLEGGSPHSDVEGSSAASSPTSALSRKASSGSDAETTLRSRGGDNPARQSSLRRANSSGSSASRLSTATANFILNAMDDFDKDTHQEV